MREKFIGREVLNMDERKGKRKKKRL